MRYIGNKTRLLPWLLATIRKLGVAPGLAHDAFAGTASVGRALRAAGWRVATSDIMTYSYVFQRAYVVASRRPSFAALRAGDPDVRRALRSPTLRARVAARGGTTLDAVGEYLSHWLEPEPGFVSAHFAPPARGYFTPENAARIDAVRAALHRWRAAGLVDDDAYHILLAALIEGADRSANTAGVYASYIKGWQVNSRRRVVVQPVAPLAAGPPAAAHLGDATAVARALGPAELLYVDPPYNTRQYRGYYHIPEIIARGWFDAPLRMRGKVGLLEDPSQRSLWCLRRRVRQAMRDLLAASGARHVLVSYNAEGIVTPPGDGGAAARRRRRRRGAPLHAPLSPLPRRQRPGGEDAPRERGGGAAVPRQAAVRGEGAGPRRRPVTSRRVPRLSDAYGYPCSAAPGPAGAVRGAEKALCLRREDHHGDRQAGRPAAARSGGDRQSAGG
jgi:adenine-specific DNA-methyltransferase